MEIEEQGAALDDEIKAEEKIADKAEEQPATITINLMLGNVENSTGTMRVRGAMGKKMLHILLDTRSSHNFLSEKLGKLAIGEVVTMDTLQVTVADGG